jgi:DNA-binding IclR family transcriptional regulator
MSKKNQHGSQSAAKVLEVLDLLMGNFVHGVAPSEVVKATGLSPSTTSRCIAALQAADFAERIPETDRIRPSIRFAQMAIKVMGDIDRAKHRLDEVQSRLFVQR